MKRKLGDKEGERWETKLNIKKGICRKEYVSESLNEDKLIQMVLMRKMTEK